ncbi:MAG: peroxiredoxin [Bacteroidales bacterium]
MKKTISMIAFLSVIAITAQAQVELGEKVPNFSAIDQDGSTWVLKKHLKQSDYLVVYFYPAAFTGGCTAQACAYRDQKGDLEAVGAQVVGISGDTPETLELFATEHGLNFTLLSDESGEIASLFDVPYKLGGGTHQEVQGKEMDIERGSTIQRWTFILDRKGTLIYKDTEVNAAEDSHKVVEFLSSL